MSINLSDQRSHTYMVVPVFNEESRFDLSYWKNMMQIKNTTWIFIDDGSTDNTLSMLLKVTHKTNSIVLSNHLNVGKGPTIRRGFSYISQNLIMKKFSNSQLEIQNLNFGYIDSDGAFNIEEVDDFIQFSAEMCHLELKSNSRTKKVKGRKTKTGGAINSCYTSVWASRVKLSGRAIERSSFRHFVGRVIHTVFGLFIESIPYDSQCGLKIFRIDSTLTNIFREEFRTEWLFDLEIMLRGRQVQKNSTCIKIWERPLLNWQEVPKGKLNIKSSAQILREMLILISLAIKTK